MSEYWIHEDGTVTFADGDADIAQPNHEMLVWEALFDQFREDLLATKHILLAELYDLTAWEQGDPTALCETILNLSDAWVKEGKAGEDVYDDPYGFVRGLLGWDEHKFNLLLCQGKEADEDLRLWAAVNWGWIRVAGNCLESWGLTKATLAQMAKGLAEIAFTHGDEHTELDLYDHQAQKFYREVPLAAIEGGDLSFKRLCFTV